MLPFEASSRCRRLEMRAVAIINDPADRGGVRESSGTLGRSCQWPRYSGFIDLGISKDRLKKRGDFRREGRRQDVGREDFG